MTRDGLYQRISGICLFMVLILGTGNCDKPPHDDSSQLVKVDSGTLVMMGTFARIQLRCQNPALGRQALAAALEALEQVDRLMSTYRDDSELSLVNRRAALEPVCVSPETFRLLQNSLDFSRQSQGAFDITVAPLVRLWKQAALQNRLPSESEINRAKANVGYEKLQLSEQHQTVAFTQNGVELDVNAIAKGYAVDQALAALRRPGVAAALVDIGGEIACFGQDEPAKDWLIGIQDPFADDTDDPLSKRPRWFIRLTNRAVATSGNYRRYVVINGKNFSHIIDPGTGQPAMNLPSVTIVADTCEKADALATAVCVLGPQKGLELIETQPATEAFLVAGTADEPIIYRSGGFKNYEIE